MMSLKDCSLWVIYKVIQFQLMMRPSWPKLISLAQKHSNLFNFVSKFIDFNGHAF